MFNTIAVGIILLDGWGMIGIWTNKFGFHNTWEVWVCFLPTQRSIYNIFETEFCRSTKLSTDFSFAHGTAILKS